MQNLVFDLFEPETKPQPVHIEIDETLKAQFKVSSRTAIARSKESAPLQVLIEKSLLSKGSTLHFGKGRAHLDSAALLRETSSCSDYDYTHHPSIEVLGSSYTNVFASYVVNTLQYDARMYVYQTIAKSTNGVAFIAARSDSNIKGTPNGDGFLTSIKTFQKKYLPQELYSEAKDFFEHVVEIKGRSGFQLIACSHNPLPEKILAQQKLTK
jgi:hypothetical protein